MYFPVWHSRRTLAVANRSHKGWNFCIFLTSPSLASYRPATHVVTATIPFSNINRGPGAFASAFGIVHDVSLNIVKGPKECTRAARAQWNAPLMLVVRHCVATQQQPISYTTIHTQFYSHPFIKDIIHLSCLVFPSFFFFFLQS